MVKIMENPIKMDDLGGKPTIFGNIHISIVPKDPCSIFTTSLDLTFTVDCQKRQANVGNIFI